MKRALMLGLAFAASMAQAKDVELFSDYGCESFEIQEARLQLATTVFRFSAMKAQGMESPESKSFQMDASQAMVDVSKRYCKQLTGTYKQLGTKKLPGGMAIQVQYDKATTLWVMQ